MPIVLGLFGLAPLLLGLVLEYLCCRLPKRRKAWRCLPPVLAAVFGGIGSIPGAVIGAFIIGICENIIRGGASIFGIPGTGWTTFSDAFTFALLIIILVVKPTGLFGEKSIDKV